MLSLKLTFHSDNTDSKTSRHFSDKKDNFERGEKYEFEQIYASLVASFKKKKYRKIFEFLDTKERLYRQSDLLYQLFFSHMKMNCIMKIIDKKFNKYIKTPQIKGIEKWFKFANILLNKFSRSIFKLNKEELKEQCEYVLLYYIKINYYHALYSKHKKDNKEYIYYLIMTEQIIKNVINKVTFPQIFIYINRVYLLISNLLIQDNAIFSAINYLLKVLKICNCVKKTEIELKTKKEKSNNNNFFSTIRENEILNEDSNFEYIITELNFIAAITFCLLGICFEKLNEYFLSNSSYRYAKWITENHLSDDSEFNKLAKLLRELVDKSTKEKNIITIISKIDMAKFISKHKKKPKRKIIDSFDDKKLMKYKILEKKLDKLKIKDSEQFQQILLTDNNNNDENQKSNKIKIMTNNVILLNYLSSAEFKPVIYQIKNMNIYNMNKETEMLISKKLENIKKKFNSSTQVNKSKNSADDSNNNSYFGYNDKLRKIQRERFQSEMSIKGINLIDHEKKHLDKTRSLKNFNDEKNIMRFPSLKSKLSSKNLINRNLMTNLFDNNSSKNSKGKESVRFENKNIDFLNETSSFFDNFSIKKNKVTDQRSLSIKISSDISENSSFSNEINNLNHLQNSHHLNQSPPQKYKILINNKEFSKFNPEQVEKKIIIKEDVEKKIFKENIRKRKNKVPKPKNNKKMDKYIFNKAYSKKFEYLDNLTSKEYKFQKSILRNKSFEKIFDEKFEPEKCKKDAELFYVKTLDEKLRLLEEKVQNLENLDKFNYGEKNIEKKLLLYQKRACTTLNYKYKEKYHKLLEDFNRNKDSIKKDNSVNENLNFRKNSVGYNLTNVNENNNMQMNIIGSKIEKIEKKISKSLSQIKNRKKLIGTYQNIKKANKKNMNLKKIESINNKPSFSIKFVPLKLDKFLNNKVRKSAFINSNLIV